MQVFFDTWFEQFAHEKIGKLSAFQWFVITSWIMRVDVPHEFLIRFTGESSGTISMTCFRWAKRMERRAAHSFIGVPDIALLLDSVPQCHVDNGMGNCVGFGDGVDVTTDSVRVHSRVNQMQHSAKLNTSAARAVALATGGGHVMGVSPMALARATEGRCSTRRSCSRRSRRSRRPPRSASTRASRTCSHCARTSTTASCRPSSTGGPRAAS
tara:strand:+ start:35 stop:670 length:636 start_codon:yes stop_codon:yes gene_type:complete